MRILAAVDGSHASVQAARYGAKIARLTGGSVVLARAVSPAVFAMAQRPARLPEDPILQEARVGIEPLGAPIVEKLLEGRPGTAVTQEVQAGAYDLVTIGSRGRGESGTPSVFLGSAALQILREAKAPVLVVRATETGEPAGGLKTPQVSKILVPTDGSLASISAADLGASLAAAAGAQVTLLHAHSPRPPKKGRPAEEDVLEVSREPFMRRGQVVRSIAITGDPGPTILHTARDEGFDLIIMGSYGVGEAWQQRMRLGSIAETVLVATPCPVILVKHEAVMELDGGYGIRDA